MIFAFREEFYLAGGKDETGISEATLSAHWQAELSRTHNPLSTLDRLAVDAYTADIFSRMDLLQVGRVSMEEWVHHHMLLGHMQLAEKLNPRLRAALKKAPQALKEIQGAFDPSIAPGGVSTGRVMQMRPVKPLRSTSFSTVLPPFSDATTAALWALAPKSLRESGGQTSLAQRSETIIACASQAATSAAARRDECAGYVSFLAHCLGRRRSEVTLHFYDISSGMARGLSKILLGRAVDGIWHTGVVVFGQEYYFSGLTEVDKAGQTKFGKPTRKSVHGWTLLDQDEIHQYICSELKPMFNRCTYDFFSCNCNHFSDRLALFLTGKRLSTEITRQSDLVSNVDAVRPVLKLFLSWYIPDACFSADEKKGSSQNVSKRTSKVNFKIGDVVSISQEKSDSLAKVGVICEDLEARDHAKASPRGRIKSGASAADDRVLVRCFDLRLPGYMSSKKRCTRIHTDVVPFERLVPVARHAAVSSYSYRDELDEKAVCVGI
eukprot:TRINITY_DN44443_c0_g1_i1.p1 TRINITY_DN44443_c0_g1~~TRINITY_DN44443_c0_g1_i1.p1  ORF type:complete len:493 (+),score=49.92 TRINITY_DN44443_c0_g1_i1:90-1568(+)